MAPRETARRIERRQGDDGVHAGHDRRVCTRARSRSSTCGMCAEGFDNFDIEACTQRGVHVTIVSDLLTDPTAELTIGLMIALGRHILPGDKSVRRDYKGWRPRFYGLGLQGTAIGILGMGAIGKAIAQRLSTFGAIVSYWIVNPWTKPMRSD